MPTNVIDFPKINTHPKPAALGPTDPLMSTIEERSMHNSAPFDTLVDDLPASEPSRKEWAMRASLPTLTGICGW